MYCDKQHRGEHCCYLPEGLPSELIVTIFEQLENWVDVIKCQRVCKKIRSILCANASRLSRPSADFIVYKDENSIWKIELSRRGDRQRKYIANNLAPFDRIEIGNFTLIGPLDEEDLRELTDALKFGIQRRIRLIRLENLKFMANFQGSKSFFNELLAEQRHCQRIELKNYAFDDSGTSFGKMVMQMDALAQLHIENDGPVEGAAICELGESALLKFACFLKHRIRRHPITLLWDVPLPLYWNVGVEGVVHALCQFIENWLHNSDIPFFHIRIRNCPIHFCGLFVEQCAQMGIAQMFMQFPSRTNQMAYIKGKYNREKCLFELYPI